MLEFPMNFYFFTIKNYLLNERRKNGADFFEVRSFNYGVEALEKLQSLFFT